MDVDGLHDESFMILPILLEISTRFITVCARDRIDVMLAGGHQGVAVPNGHMGVLGHEKPGASRGTKLKPAGIRIRWGRNPMNDTRQRCASPTVQRMLADTVLNFATFGFGPGDGHARSICW